MIESSRFEEENIIKDVRIFRLKKENKFIEDKIF